MANEEIYLKGILATVARQAFPPDRLVELVGARNGGEKQANAYNMCDGSRSQSEIAKALGLDTSNFSKMIQRWVDQGIVIKLGDGRPVHVYPIPLSMIGSKSKSKGDA
ncbi:MAG: MarR family transcriptional regulator [Rhizobiaceae bacterium]